MREVNPVSFIEIDGTSVLCYPQFNPINIVVTGDKYGNINILDLNRRIQLLKKEVSPAHRIIALDAVMIEYCDDHMITIAVASRGENVIQIWRTRARDYNPVLAARIQTARATPTPFTPQTRIDEFPCKLKFSDDGLFLAVTLYNGSVELYQVPEPPLILPVAEESELASPGSLSHVKSSSQIMESSRSRTSPSKSEISPQKQSHVQQNLSDIPTQDLSIFKRIPLRAPEKKINMEQALVQALLGNASSQGEKTPAIKEEKDKKASKKDTKKEEPKSQKKAIDGQEKLQFQSQTPGFESNEELFLGETISNPDFDVNPDPQHPKFYPDVFFNSVTLSFQPDRKRFLEKEITTTITTGITCVWHETCFAEVFEFQLPIPENAPTYFSYKNRYNLYHQLNRRKNYLEKSPIEVKPPETKESSTLPKKDSKKEGKKEEKKEEKKETAPKPNENTGKEKVPAENSNPLLKPWKTFETIYPIKTSAVSKMKGFLALGLADGSILVLETIEYSQRYLLDKHIGPVTKISFLDEWHSISGSADGGIHFHKIQGNTGELQCKKYQHVFKTQGNSIVDIQMNDFGLGFVVDNQGNARCYDLYHFEKIMRLNTKSSYAKSCKFSVWPRPLMSTGNEQFIAVCDVVDPELSEKEREVYSTWEKKTMILVYRTFETLTELFPGLANLAKKGVEKTKLMTAFGKISFKDLQDPKYEIPQFKTETEVLSTVKKTEKSSRTDPIKSHRSGKIGSSKSTIFSIKTLQISPLKQ